VEGTPRKQAFDNCVAEGGRVARQRCGDQVGGNWVTTYDSKGYAVDSYCYRVEDEDDVPQGSPSDPRMGGTSGTNYQPPPSNDPPTGGTSGTYEQPSSSGSTPPPGTYSTWPLPSVLGTKAGAIRRFSCPEAARPRVAR